MVGYRPAHQFRSADGVLGFLLVYVLNESERVEMHMRPRFVALFAFLFAVVVGTLWEIFEFAMDQLAGTRMQKPMFGDPSGLTDTMWDMIVNALGALTISALGWWYMNRGEHSFIESGFENLSNVTRVCSGCKGGWK